MLRVELIVNPIAGRGRAPQAAAALQRALGQRGVDARLALCPTQAALPGLVHAAAEHADLLVAVGGDGTLRDVVRALPRPLPIAQLPLGTANVLARELALPVEPVALAALVVDGKRRVIDLGRVNGNLFLAMVGVGFDAEIVAGVHAARRGALRQSDYVGHAARALLRGARPALAIEVDGQRLGGTFQDFIVCNTRCYGAHFAFTPAAQVDDGLLNYAGRSRASRVALARFALAAWWKRASAVGSYGIGRRFVVTAADGAALPTQVDGDPGESTPLTVEISAGAATIVAP